MDSGQKKKLHKNVYLLGWVSLFTDLSSQMIYPLIPVYLQGMGASNLLIGLIEGISESIASLFKILFGRLSDKLGKQKFFVFSGYGISSFSKPLLYLASTWPMVLLLRMTDRMGKAVRNPARDAMISLSVESKQRGRAFGIHRGMDRVGAAGGALLASLVLWLGNESIRIVFLFSGIPALLALLFIPFTREVHKMNPVISKTENAGQNSSRFKYFILSLVIFTLGNSSNAFLILKATEAGLDLLWVPILWLLYNSVASVSSPWLGGLSDKVGRKSIIGISFLLYSAIYLGFALSQSLLLIWILFGFYGVYYGTSKGIFKAYVADQTLEGKRGSAYGILQTAEGITLLPASLIMGYIWDLYGSQTAFMVSAGFSLLGFIIFTLTQRNHE